MRFGTGSRRGFGRAAARLRGRNARNRRMQRARAALNSKMPTPPKRDTSEAALRREMAKRVRQRGSSKPFVMQQAIQKAPKPQFAGAQQAKQIKRKRQFNDPTMYSEGGSVSRTGHTDYRKKGMFK